MPRITEVIRSPENVRALHIKAVARRTMVDDEKINLARWRPDTLLRRAPGQKRSNVRERRALLAFDSIINEPLATASFETPRGKKRKSARPGANIWQTVSRSSNIYTLFKKALSTVAKEIYVGEKFNFATSD